MTIEEDRFGEVCVALLVVFQFLPYWCSWARQLLNFSIWWRFWGVICDERANFHVSGYRRAGTFSLAACSILFQDGFGSEFP